MHVAFFSGAYQLAGQMGSCIVNRVSEAMQHIASRGSDIPASQRGKIESIVHCLTNVNNQTEAIFKPIFREMTSHTVFRTIQDIAITSSVMGIYLFIGGRCFDELQAAYRERPTPKERKICFRLIDPRHVRIALSVAKCFTVAGMAAISFHLSLASIHRSAMNRFDSSNVLPQFQGVDYNQCSINRDSEESEIHYCNSNLMRLN